MEFDKVLKIARDDEIAREDALYLDELGIVEKYRGE